MWNLRRILDPIPVDEFLRAHWEKQPLLVKREQRDWFAELLNTSDIDRVVATYGLHHPDIQMVSNAQPLPVERYTYPSGLVDAARLFQEFADGATIVLPQLHERLPALAALCRSMEHEISVRFQTNIYFTPKTAQGFKTHFDSHDVFVLQIHGTKRWVIYDTPVQLPFRGHRFDPATVKPGAATMEFELRPGDMVYIPRGVMHDAYTNETESLHITLGVLSTSWTDLLLEAVAMVGARDPAFREGLPVGFATDGFDRGAARETFRELLRRIGDLADFDGALEHFVDDLVSSRHALVPGQLEQVRRAESLSADSMLGARPSVLHRVREGSDDVALECYGSTLRFPAHVAPALRFALASASFRVRDLPGTLDDAGKIVLVRRLVREGILRVID